MTDKNLITPVGYEKLVSEYDMLRYQERPKLLQTIAWAAGNGDRSENADYIYGKKRLREIDRRLNFLGSRIKTAEIIEPTHSTATHVAFGATVCVEDEDGERKTYILVGEDESEPASGRISWKSPIGKSLLNARPGDYVSFKTPKGEKSLEVIEVSYVSI